MPASRSDRECITAVDCSLTIRSATAARPDQASGAKLTRRSQIAQSDSARAQRKLLGMSDQVHFTAEEARAAGERVGIDWLTSPFDVEQFRMGMDVELEHGTRDLETNVTDDDVTVTAKIARAHLNEFPDYYSRLAVMEAEAEAYWAAPGE